MTTPAADDAQRQAAAAADDDAAGIQRRFTRWSPAQCASYAARLAEYHAALEAYEDDPAPTHERMPTRTNRHPDTKHRTDTYRKA